MIHAALYLSLATRLERSNSQEFCVPLYPHGHPQVVSVPSCCAGAQNTIGFGFHLQEGQRH